MYVKYLRHRRPTEYFPQLMLLAVKQWQNKLGVQMSWCLTNKAPL